VGKLEAGRPTGSRKAYRRREGLRKQGGDDLQAGTKPNGSDPRNKTRLPPWATIRIINHVHLEKQHTVLPSHRWGNMLKTRD
jgi:hypothetical protein